MSKHQVLTKEYFENISNGIMICGINFGYSEADKIKDEQPDENCKMEGLSFFSDTTVNNTRFRNRVLSWLNSWGLNLTTVPHNENAFDRTFFQTNWLDTQTNSINSDESISIRTLVQDSDSFLTLLEERKPEVILFIGSMLIEALNDISIRDRVESILGARSGNPKNCVGELPDGKGIKFKIRFQQFGDTQIISLPHTQTRGLSNEYIASLKPFVYFIDPIVKKRLKASETEPFA